MHTILKQIQKAVYDHKGMVITDFEIEAESQEYEASRFKLNGQQVICRTAKKTPKKMGQFVCFWKRGEDGIIQPFEQEDPIDFYIVNLREAAKIGQFVFPKSVLIKEGIISSSTREGKRAFRVYPSWDLPTSKQAQRSQKWQLEYFNCFNCATPPR